MRAVMMAVVVIALAACSPGDTKKIEPPAAAPVPGDTMRETFTGCTWGEVKSAALSIWSFACGPESSNIHVVANGAGFDIVADGQGGPSQRPVVRVFEKAPDAPLDAVLPAVRAASPGPATATCAFAPSPSYDNTGKPRFVLEPTGAAKAAWDASVAGDNPGEAPCGELGVSIVGDRYFEALTDHPGTVVWVELGSEIQIFDASTLKAVGAHADAH